MSTKPTTPPLPCHRFIPQGPGQQWTIDATRSVIIQPGERGDMFVTWVNGENKVNVRLTKEAAAMTNLALLHCGKNLMADCEGEPAA